MNTRISFQISTGNGNYATPNISKFCPSNPNCFTGNNITYTNQYDPLVLLSAGQQLVDYNGSDAASFGSILDRTISDLTVNRNNYLQLTQSQQLLRIPLVEFLTALRDVCREHPSCFVYFYP